MKYIFIEGGTVSLYNAQLSDLIIQLFDYYNFMFKLFFRKLQERQAVFKKLSYAQKDRKWQKVFSINFISSEKIDVDRDDAIKFDHYHGILRVLPHFYIHLIGNQMTRSRLKLNDR